MTEGQILIGGRWSAPASGHKGPFLGALLQEEYPDQIAEGLGLDELKDGVALQCQ